MPLVEIHIEKDCHLCTESNKNKPKLYRAGIRMDDSSIIDWISGYIFNNRLDATKAAREYTYDEYNEL